MSATVSDDRPTSATPPRKVNHVRRVLTIWAISSLVCVALVIVLGSVVNPTSGSSDADFANLTNVLFTALAVPVALFV